MREELKRGEAAWNRYRREHPDEDAPDLTGLQFPQADLSRFDLSGASLQRAYLRGAQLRDASLTRTDLQGAYLIDADLESADLSHSRLLAANFNGANLSRCSFQGSNLREADLGGADATGADFSDADLLGANLLGADLEGARFERTKGLSSRQLMAASNWRFATFSSELAAELDLPNDGAEREFSAGAKRIANVAKPAPEHESPELLPRLACLLDPSLG